MKHGLPEDEAYERFVIIDADGAIGKARDLNNDALLPLKTSHVEDGATLLEAVKKFKPTGLLGLSTVHGIFTKEILTLMGEMNERPMVFPLSNPTSRAECTAQEAADATEGRAIFSSGSPFPDAEANGRFVKANQGVRRHPTRQPGYFFFR